MIVVQTIGTQDNLFIYLYNYDGGQFSLKTTNAMAINGRVSNVIANDFNQDNKIDFLVSYYNQDTETYNTILFTQGEDYIFSINSSLDLPKSKTFSSIFVADFNGDTM